MKCCDLTAGQLRHKINIEREARVADGLGGYNIVWSIVATPRAKIMPVSGNERFQAQRLEANITHRIYIRYDANILASDKIVFDGREMQIRALLNLEERNKWFEIYADEGQAV